MEGSSRGPGGAVTRVSHPLPQLGACAVFSKAVGARESISETTAVQRVVYRLRVVDVGREEDAKNVDWQAVGGSWPTRDR